MKSFSGLSIFLVLSTFLLVNCSFGQELPEITDDEIQGFQITRNECFDGPSLWGYMNGGADLYLEYGFEKLRVEEFSNDNEIIKLELFKMDSPVSAFGIYSIKTFKCEQSNVITTLDCLNRFQFQLLVGNYYIQFINESGSEKAKRAMEDIAKILAKKIEHTELQLPAIYLTDSLNFSLSEIKMVKGELGLHNKAIALEEYFKDIEDYQVYFAKRELDGKMLKYYEVIFGSQEMKNKFLKNSKDEDLLIIRGDNNNILIQQ